MLAKSIHQALAETTSPPIVRHDHVIDRGTERTVRQHSTETDEPLAGVFDQAKNKTRVLNHQLHVCQRPTLTPPLFLVESVKLPDLLIG